MTHHEALERAAPPSAIVDESFRIVHLSETAGRYLQPSAGPLANDITELAREELRFDLRTALYRVFSHGEASLSPPIAVRFNGAQRRVYLQVKLARSEPNAARAAIVFFFEGEALREESDKATDLEERTLEARLRRLHGDRLSSMAAMASALAHELNQPLSAAANYLEAAQRLLRACPGRPPGVGEALDSAVSQMLRAGRIVSHLHEFISRGDPEKITQSFHAIIRQTCEIAAPLIKEHRVDVILRLDADKDSILADKAQIQQVLVNLIRNACEAMRASKIRRLTIATMVEDAMLRTDVIDTGVGLSKAVDADFFEPFASSKSNGLDVGLPVSRSIVEAHQGKIWADPGAGGGARFSFTLPLAEAGAVEE